jgi:glycosyltransferase involved in cell wall biosynthesis
MFVLGDCHHDVRVLREAATLQAAGYAVTIMALTSDPYAAAGEREVRPDGVTILRVPVAGGALRWLLLARRPRSFVAALRAWAGSRAARPPRGWVELAVAAAVGLVAAPVVLSLGAMVWVGAAVAPIVPGLRSAWLAVSWRLQWRFSILPWGRAAAEAAPPAVVVHAHDMRALPAARRLREATGAAFVYDSHELFVEAGLNGRRPIIARQAMRRLERHMATGADALVTVNDELATALRPALGLPRAVVVRNCPPRWSPLPGPPPDHLRRALGLPAGTPLALYHGGFMPDRGLVETVLAWRRPELAAVHLVLMGSGVLRATLADLAAAPAAGGRVHLLPAVPPDELLAWVAGADVGLMLNQPRTLNERLSTPNKLFECLAVGTPVVSSDFPARRHIIIDDPDGPLGAVCDPTDPAAIAAAVLSILDRPPADRAALRARIHAAAAARYAWEGQLATVLREYGALTGRPW